jgi:hypothetical protein
MEYPQDVELIITSLTKEKRELLDKVSEIDKAIKRIKYGNLNVRLSKGITNESNIAESETTQKQQAFPLKADLKVQVIKIFEILGGSCQTQRHSGTGINHNLRETLRNLNKHEILKLLQPKGTQRGLYWVKTEWLEENGTRLKEQHKFEGFDLLFSDDMIEFK